MLRMLLRLLCVPESADGTSFFARSSRASPNSPHPLTGQSSILSIFSAQGCVNLGSGAAEGSALMVKNAKVASEQASVRAFLAATLRGGADRTDSSKVRSKF